MNKRVIFVGIILSIKCMAFWSSCPPVLICLSQIMTGHCHCWIIVVLP